MKMYRFSDRLKTIVNLDNVLTIYGWNGCGSFESQIIISFKDQKETTTLYYNSKEERDCELNVLACKKE